MESSELGTAATSEAPCEAFPVARPISMTSTYLPTAVSFGSYTSVSYSSAHPSTASTKDYVQIFQAGPTESSWPLTTSGSDSAAAIAASTGEPAREMSQFLCRSHPLSGDDAQSMPIASLVSASQGFSVGPHWGTANVQAAGGPAAQRRYCHHHDPAAVTFSVDSTTTTGAATASTAPAVISLDHGVALSASGQRPVMLYALPSTGGGTGTLPAAASGQSTVLSPPSYFLTSPDHPQQSHPAVSWSTATSPTTGAASRSNSVSLHASSGHHMKPAPLSSAFSSLPTPTSASGSNSKARRNVYITNLPLTWNTSKLCEYCAVFGNILSAKVMHHEQSNTPLGCGFVLFETEAQAARCIAELHQRVIEDTAPMVITDATEGAATSPSCGLRTLLCRYAHERAAPSFEGAPTHTTAASDSGVASGMSTYPHSFFLFDRTTDAMMLSRGPSPPLEFGSHRSEFAVGSLPSGEGVTRLTTIPPLGAVAAMDSQYQHQPQTGGCASTSSRLLSSPHMTPPLPPLPQSFCSLGSSGQLDTYMHSLSLSSESLGFTSGLSGLEAGVERSLSSGVGGEPVKKKRGCRGGTNGESSCNVYITNIPPTWNTSKLVEVCSRFGLIVSAKVAHHAVTNESLGYGFVLFDNERSAAACVERLRNVSIPGIPPGPSLFCRYAREKATPSIARGRSGNSVDGGVASLHPHNVGGEDSYCSTATAGFTLDDRVVLPAEVFGTFKETGRMVCNRIVGAFHAKEDAAGTSVHQRREQTVEEMLRTNVVYASNVPADFEWRGLVPLDMTTRDDVFLAPVQATTDSPLSSIHDYVYMLSVRQNSDRTLLHACFICVEAAMAKELMLFGPQAPTAPLPPDLDVKDSCSTNDRSTPSVTSPSLSRAASLYNPTTRRRAVFCMEKDVLPVNAPLTGCVNGSATAGACSPPDSASSPLGSGSAGAGHRSGFSSPQNSQGPYDAVTTAAAAALAKSGNACRVSGASTTPPYSDLPRSVSSMILLARQNNLITGNALCGNESHLLSPVSSVEPYPMTQQQHHRIVPTTSTASASTPTGHLGISTTSHPPPPLSVIQPPADGTFSVPVRLPDGSTVYMLASASLYCLPPAMSAASHIGASANVVSQTSPQEQQPAFTYVYQ